MTIREHVSLAALTTLRVGGDAKFVIDCEQEEDIEPALALRRERGLPLYVLGGGSNVLASDTGFPGIILRPKMGGITFAEQSDGSTEVTVGAGVVWDELVRVVAERELWGLENLAGIPGTVGASPVQNVGAYGADVSDTFLWCDARSLESGDAKRFSREAAQFAYRDSVFKHEPGWVITRVTFRLRAHGVPRLDYADLARAKEAGVSLATPAEVGEAVRAIRARKFPGLQKCGTAGSFFKNPVVDGVKIPLARILDGTLGLKGYRVGHVRLFEKHPLILVTETGATADDIESFANDIAEKVFYTTNIRIEREVQSIK